MQIKKDKVRDRIIHAAYAEFLRVGYADASLRKIAAAAEVTKGNIYIYFSSKGDLYKFLVEPGLRFLKNTMSSEEEGPYLERFLSLEPSDLKDSRDGFAAFVYSLREYERELRLLFFASAGSDFAGFREDIFELYSRRTREFTANLSRLRKGKVLELSEMFVHSLAAMYIRFIEELLVHNPGPKELEEYITQMSILVHTGFAFVIHRLLEDN